MSVSEPDYGYKIFPNALPTSVPNVQYNDNAYYNQSAAGGIPNVPYDTDSQYFVSDNFRLNLTSTDRRK